MGYEDRDYFQSKPRFEAGPGLMPATKGLIVALAAAYLSALVVSNHVNFMAPAFLLAALTDPDGGASWLWRLVVLTPHNIIPAHGAFEPAPWKLLTHLLVPQGLLPAVFDALGIYFVGRFLEPQLGTRRFLLLLALVGVASGLMAALSDPWLLGSEKLAVIMGPQGALIGVFCGAAWIAPNQPSLGNWPMKRVVGILVGLFALAPLVFSLVSREAVVGSATQALWGAVVGNGLFFGLRRRGKLPFYGPQGIEREFDSLPKYDEREAARLAAEDEKQEREAARLKAEAGAEQEKLDAILAKISREGIGALSRTEKKFLDEQSRRRRS